MLPNGLATSFKLGSPRPVCSLLGNDSRSDPSVYHTSLLVHGRSMGHPADNENIGVGVIS